MTSAEFEADTPERGDQLRIMRIIDGRVLGQRRGASPRSRAQEVAVGSSTASVAQGVVPASPGVRSRSLLEPRRPAWQCHPPTTTLPSPAAGLAEVVEAVVHPSRGGRSWVPLEAREPPWECFTAPWAAW